MVKVSNNKQGTSGQALGRLARPNKLTRYAFYGIVFAFPWEYLDLELGVKITLTKLMGFFFFGAALLQPKICFRFPPKVFWLFLMYLGLFAMLATAGDAAYDRAIFMRGFTLIQMLVLFWLSYNVMHDERAVKGFLLALIGGCLSLAIGGMFLEELVRTGAEGRLTGLGEGANTAGATFALGLMAILGLAFGRQGIRLKTQLLACFPFLIMAGFLIKTGSRGAMLALVIGIVFFLVKGGNVRIKIGLVIMVLLGLMALVGLSLNTDMGERFERTLSKGDTAGRETIFLEAVAMVNEKPLMGWGPKRFTAELGKRLGKEERATHNLYLKLLLEVGILGAVPFLLGLGMCFRAAWKARYGLEGSLPVAMLVTLLMLNMSGSWDNRKIFWIILAYTLVSTRYTYSRKSTEDDSCSGKNYGVGFRKTFKKSDSSVVVGQTH